MKISVIITVHGNDIDRYVNLLQLLKCLKNQTRKPDEVIIVEQHIGNDSRYYYQVNLTELNIQYIPIVFTGHEKLFSVSWCRNVGIYKATGDIVVCIDCDYMFDNSYIETILNISIENYYLGWSTIYFIERTEKNRVIWYDSFPKVDDKTDLRISTKDNFREGGIQIFNKQWFIDNLVGFSEDMFGWGREDVEITTRMRIIFGTPEKLGDLNQLNYTIYHLWHRKNPAIKDLLNNHRVMEQNLRDRNVALTAQRMREVSVGNPEHPNPIYKDSVKWSEP